MIFGIGLFKTGTTSLSKALKILGFKTIDGPRKQNPIILKNLRLGQGLVEGLPYQAFTDSLLHKYYRELDIQYPNSQFILTMRDVDSWVRSAKWHNRNKRHITEKKYRESHYRHYSEALEYFGDETRHERVLIYHLCDGVGWPPLCKFLDKPIPNKPFPWRNCKTKESMRKKHKGKKKHKNNP